MTTSKNKSCVFSVVGILSLSLIAILIFFIWSEQDGRQYQEFLDAEARNAPLFDALNLSTYNELPLPEGALVIDQNSSDNYGHGRTLRTEYQISNTSIEAITSFYDQFLLSNGWKLNTEVHNRIDKQQGARFGYYKGTACIDIFSFNYGVDPVNYFIDIYYDYFAQRFSLNPTNTPALRNKKYGQTPWQEFGETGFLRCPVSDNSMPIQFWKSP
jgi:hypothetical protein